MGERAFMDTWEWCPQVHRYVAIEAKRHGHQDCWESHANIGRTIDSLRAQLTAAENDRDSARANYIHTRNLLHDAEDRASRAEGERDELLRYDIPRQRLAAAEAVVQAVREWGEYTPRRVSRALAAYDASTLPSSIQEGTN